MSRVLRAVVRGSMRNDVRWAAEAACWVPQLGARRDAPPHRPPAMCVAFRRFLPCVRVS